MTALSPPNNRIRLQIWRFVDQTVIQMLLVFEQVVEVVASPESGRLYTFTINPTFQVATNDLIGWTYEGDVGAISFKYDNNHHTYFRKFDQGVFPRLSEAYIFDEVYLPSVFSVAVLLESDATSQTNTNLSSSVVTTTTAFRPTVQANASSTSSSIWPTTPESSSKSPRASATVSNASDSPTTASGTLVGIIVGLFAFCLY
jgi:hypothetical protein